MIYDDSARWRHIPYHFHFVLCQGIMMTHEPTDLCSDPMKEEILSKT